MVKMDSVVHFEIPFDNDKRATNFYKKTFGWVVNPMKEMDYILVYTAETDMGTFMIQKTGAINGGMMKRNTKIKSPVITIGVDDMDASLKKTEKNGGSVLVKKTAVGDMGFSAYIKDTEGNIIGLFQSTKK